jgi:hypothetical protein
MIIKENQVTVDINFLVPFRDFHLVSQDYEINKLVLENWTLNRIKVPDFKDRDEMKDWIIAVDFIIKSESFVISGPAFRFYYAETDGDYYTKQLEIEDVNNIVYQIPERNYYDKNGQPSDLMDTNKLYKYVKEDVNAFLDYNTYGCCLSDKISEKKYFFQNINMCGIVDFLLNSDRPNYLPPQDQLMFAIKTEDYSLEEDFDETNAYWAFKNIKDNDQVYIVEFKYKESIKEKQLEFFDLWVMWHEKFIYNNTMYFVLFQTDEIHNEDLLECFSQLKNSIYKKYYIKPYILTRKSYLEFKLSLRSTDLNEK